MRINEKGDAPVSRFLPVQSFYFVLIRRFKEYYSTISYLLMIPLGKFDNSHTWITTYDKHCNTEANQVRQLVS
jgi:hypothetical protein